MSTYCKWQWLILEALSALRGGRLGCAFLEAAPQKGIAASSRSRYSAASRIQPIGARLSYPDLTIPYSSASIGVATSATGRRRKNYMTTEITFASLALAEPIMRAIADAGYTTPTPIQAQAIPQVLAGGGPPPPGRGGDAAAPGAGRADF